MLHSWTHDQERRADTFCVWETRGYFNRVGLCLSVCLSLLFSLFLSHVTVCLSVSLHIYLSMHIPHLSSSVSM